MAAADAKTCPRRKRPEDESEDQDWLMTYGDAVTLLMTFLVLLLSVSTVDQSKYEQVVEAVKEHGLNADKKYESPFDTLTKEIEQVTQKLDMKEEMKVIRQPKGVTIELASSTLYPVGSAEIQTTAAGALSAVARAIKDFEYDKYQVEVEGHTDDVAINTLRYPSNWELSVHRATNIVRYLSGEGVDKTRMKAAGYADTRPKVPNLDDGGQPIPENRAANRRIVIHIERDDAFKTGASDQAKES